MALGSGGGAGSRPTSSCHPRARRRTSVQCRAAPSGTIRSNMWEGLGALDRSRFLAIPLGFECLVSP